MFRKILKIVLIVILAAVLIRALMVLAGYKTDQITGNKVAVLDFTGQIFSSEKIIDQLSKLEKNPNVKGIILRVNSPGGAVAPSNEIYDYIVTMDKPLYAAMGSVAASGGYLVSLGADRIYAMPSTITGSIGVIMSFMNMEQLFDKIGVKSVIIKSGKYKDIGNPDRPLTEDERAVMTAVVMDMYDQFVSTVSARRNMDKNEVIKLADGRVYTGRMARELNLVDSLGTWRDAFTDMKAVLNIPDLEYYEVPRRKKWWEELNDASSSLRNFVSKPYGLYYLAEVY